MISEWAPAKAEWTFDMGIAWPRKPISRVNGVSGIRKGMGFAVSDFTEGSLVANKRVVSFEFVRLASVEFAD